MSLSLNVLNSDCSINAFQISSSAQIIGGETAEIVLQLFQPSKKIRYIPAEDAEFSITLLNSDGSELEKTPTLKFPDDDRSMLLLELSAEETAALIGQNLIVEITEGAKVSIAVLQMGLQKVNLGSC